MMKFNFSSLFLVFYSFLPLFYASISCPNGTTHINLQLNWFSQSEFAGFIAANELGFYHQACLAVNIYPGGPEVSEIKEASSGQANFAITWLPNLLVALDTYKPNVTLLTQLFRRTGMLLMSFKDKDITTIDELAGKKVCAFGNGAEIDLKMALNEASIKWDTNWDLGATDGDLDIVLQTPDMQQLYSRECDVVSALRYSELGVVLTAVGPNEQLYTVDEFNFIDFAEIGFAGLEDCLIANTSWLLSHEAQTINFLRATFKGFMWVRDHPYETMDFFVNNPPLQFYELSEINAMIWPATPNGIGIVPTSLLQQTHDLAHRYGIIQNTIDLNTFYKPDYATKAQQGINQGYTWGMTKYGPGSADITAANFHRLEVLFCLGESGTAIICEPVHKEEHTGTVIFVLVVLTLVVGIVLAFLVFHFRHKLVTYCPYFKRYVHDEPKELSDIDDVEEGHKEKTEKELEKADRKQDEKTKLKGNTKKSSEHDFDDEEKEQTKKGKDKGREKEGGRGKGEKPKKQTRRHSDSDLSGPSDDEDNSAKKKKKPQKK